LNMMGEGVLAAKTGVFVQWIRNSVATYVWQKAAGPGR
jgi:hypothetical protein